MSGLLLRFYFLDEAHKLSGKNSRGPFYYKVVDMLLKRRHTPHFIFDSPNIPNPPVYLRLMNDVIENGDENKLASTFSPVIQVKFLMDFNEGKVSIYNDKTGRTIPVIAINDENARLNKMLPLFEHNNSQLPPEKRSQTIVYYNGRAKAIEAARIYAESSHVVEKHDAELEALSKDITQEVHGELLSGRNDKERCSISYRLSACSYSYTNRVFISSR